MGKNCKDYIGDLNGYLDGGIDPELCREIEKHIGQCDNCRIMIDSMKQTVTLCRDGRSEKLPPAIEDKLTGLLRKKWDEKFGGKKD